MTCRGPVPFLHFIEEVIKRVEQNVTNLAKSCHNK